MSKLFFKLTFLLFIISLKSFSQKEYIIETLKYRSAVQSVEFSKDASLLIVGLNDGNIVLYDVANNQELSETKAHLRAVNDICFTHEGKHFLTTGDRAIKLWSLNGTEIMILTGSTTDLWSIDISSKDKWIVGGCYDKKFFRWELESGAMLGTFEGHDASVLAVCVSPDDKYIASGSLDHQVKIWDAQNGEVLHSLQGHSDNIYRVVFDKTGNKLLSCSRDNTIKLWDTQEGKHLRTFIGHQASVLDLQIVDEVFLLSCSADKTIRLWEINSGKTIYSFIEHESIINSIDYNQNIKQLASGSTDGKVFIWDLGPAVFVEYKYPDEIKGLISSDPLFKPREKGESREEYQTRMEKTEPKRESIYNKYYQKYKESLLKE